MNIWILVVLVRKIVGAETLLNNNETAENTRLNILLAEDEPANQLLIERLLNIAGHDVTIADNGQQALDYLNSNSYDLCIFDMQMPVMNGIEAVQSYKKMQPLSDLPFIMLTANIENEAIKECINAGVNMHLSKPVVYNDLTEAIKTLVDVEKSASAVNTLIIDITKLNSYEDQAFLDKFIEIFENSSDKLINDLNNALENNFVTFKNVVHSIKGLSGNIGATVLREKTVKAEQLSEDDYRKKSNKHYKNIVDELTKVRCELVKLSSNNRSGMK